MVAALLVGALELLVASPVASFDPLMPSPARGRASLAIGTVQVPRSQTLAAVSAAFASNSATMSIAGASGARGSYTMSAELRRLEGCTLVVHQSASLKYDDSAIATFDWTPKPRSRSGTSTLHRSPPCRAHCHEAMRSQPSSLTSPPPETSPRLRVKRAGRRSMARAETCPDRTRTKTSGRETARRPNGWPRLSAPLSTSASAVCCNHAGADHA